MKYLPLVWSAFRRHTTESLLTFLVITVAFTLFGTMVALKLAYVQWLNTNPVDRLFVTERFARLGLSIGVRDQIARIPGVTGTTLLQGVFGYHQEPDKQVGVWMFDGATVTALPELNVTADHWKALEATPTGLIFSRAEAAKWSVKPGDPFPIISPSQRADGGEAWQFTVLAVVDDPRTPVNYMPNIYGNYNSFDVLRAPERRGRVSFIVSVADEEKAQGVCQRVDAMFANSDAPTYCRRCAKMVARWRARCSTCGR